MPAVPLEDLSRASQGESSIKIRERVEKARAQMFARQGKENALLSTREVDEHCVTDETGAALLRQAINTLGLSARGYHRILRVARTVADLAGGDRIATNHVGEAIQCRRFDRAGTFNTAFRR